MSKEKDISTKDKKEDDNMSAMAVQRTGYKKLNLSALNYADKIITSEEALKNVAPLEWSEKVLSGEKKVIIKKQ